MFEESSVFGLITNLIEHNLNTFNPSLRNKEKYNEIKKKLRIKSFEILLKHHSTNEENDPGPLTNMVAYYFQLIETNNQEKALELNKSLNYLINNDLYQDPLIFSFLKILVRLIEPEKDFTIKSCFNLQNYEMPENYEQIVPYKTFTDDDFNLPQWMELNNNSNSNLNNDIFFQEPGTGLRLLSQFAHFSTHSKIQMDNYKTYSQDLFFQIPELNSPRELLIPNNPSPAQTDEGYESPCYDLIASNFKPENQTESINSEISSDDENILDYWENILLIELPKLKTWETLGNLKTNEDKSFLTDFSQDIVHKLWKLDNHTFKLIFEKIQPACLKDQTNQANILKIITLDKFLSDLKNLLIGIQSTTFVKECNTFIISPNICLEGLSPEALLSYSEDFIICGTFYHRLKILCMPNEQTGVYHYEGNIFKAMCKSFKKFLLFYRVAALSLFKTKNLLSIKNQLTQLKNMIVSIARLAKLDICQANSLPEGVNLLAYLYEEMGKITDQSVSYVLFSALHSCCQVYYRFIQQWIFEGVCDDPYEEFFIHHSQHYSLNKNRRYWNKSFRMINSAIPGFLNGIQNQILQCGKAVHLLKICKPENFLPEIKCCFTKEEQYILQKNCDRYYKEVLEEYGSLLSIAVLMNEETERKKNLERIVQEEFGKRMRAFKIQQQNIAIKIAQEKEKQLTIIKEQITLVQQHKEKNLQKEIELEKEMEEEQKKLTDLINEEKEEMIEYYKNLSSKSEEKTAQAKNYIEILKKELKKEEEEEISSENTPNSDDLNSNTQSTNDLDVNKNLSNPTLENQLDNENHNIDDPRFNISNNKNELIRNRWRNMHGDINIITGEIRSRSCERFKYTNNINETNLKKLSSDDSLLSFKTASESEYHLEVNKSKNIEINSNKEIELIEKEEEISNPPEKTVSNSSTEEKESLKTDYPLILKYASTKTEIIHIKSDKSKFELHVDIKEKELLPLLPFEIKEKLIREKYTESSEFPTALTDASEFENGFLFPVRVTQSETPNIENKKEDFSKLDMSSINETLHKSVLIPLTIQMKLVNDALLKYYIKDLRFLSHLTSLRNYFFLFDGEFGYNLTDALFKRLNEISKPEDLLNARSLNYILARALASSVRERNEINGDRLSFSIKFMPKHIQNSSPEVLSCLSLKYKVTWPLNILIPEEILLKYDLIFEYLLKIRRVSWVLDQDCQKMKFLYKDPLIDNLALSRSPQYHTIQLYRNEMTHLIRALQNYIITIALHASWMELQQLLNKSETLDQLYKIHISYIKKILFRCLLNEESSPIQSVIIDIFGFILKFHGLLTSRSWIQNEDTKMYEHPNYEMINNVVAKFKKSGRFLYKYALKLATSGYQSFSIELVNMLNINDYYSNQKNKSED